MTGYKIVKRQNIFSLEEEINKNLSEGRELYGEISIIELREGKVYGQTMIQKAIDKERIIFTKEEKQMLVDALFLYMDYPDMDEDYHEKIKKLREKLYHETVQGETSQP